MHLLTNASMFSEQLLTPWNFFLAVWTAVCIMHGLLKVSWCWQEHAEFKKSTHLLACCYIWYFYCIYVSSKWNFFYEVSILGNICVVYGILQKNQAVNCWFLFLFWDTVNCQHLILTLHNSLILRYFYQQCSYRCAVYSSPCLNSKSLNMYNWDLVC